MSTQERRKFPRTRLDLPLDLNIGEQTISSRIMDISTSGIRFRTPKALPLMSRVQLAIELGKGTGTPLALSGVVVRSEVADEDDGDADGDADGDSGSQPQSPANQTAYETAIFFDDLTDKMHRQLREFLVAKDL